MGSTSRKITVGPATPVAVVGTQDDPIYINPGSAAIQTAISRSVRISVTPTINTVQYTSGDCIGGLQSIANAVRANTLSGILQSVVVLDRSQSQRAAMDLLLFDRSVTVAGNNSPVAMSDADMANCLGLVSLGPYNTAWPGTPLNSIASLYNIGIPLVLQSTTLYCQAVVRGVPTYAVGDLTFSYTILQD